MQKFVFIEYDKGLTIAMGSQRSQISLYISIGHIFDATNIEIWA